MKGLIINYSGEMEPLTVLIVEDEANLASALKRQFEGWGFDSVEVVETRQQALDSIRHRVPSLVIMQVQLEESWQTVETGLLISHLPLTPIIFIGTTVKEVEDEKWLLLLASQQAHSLKPYTEEDLKTAVETALKLTIPVRERR